jgi:hypothetical protein
MNPERFDELTRALTTTRLSRWQIVKLLGAGVVANTFPLLAVKNVSAKKLCKGVGSKCSNNSQCCSGQCDKGTRTCACSLLGFNCNSSSDCCDQSGLSRCTSGKCSCVPDNQPCFFQCCAVCEECNSLTGECQDKQCGSCKECNPLTGNCVSTGTPCGTTCCSEGETCCNDMCVDTSTDRLNCGACGNKCALCEDCEQGNCVSTGTPCGTTDCCSEGETCCQGQGHCRNLQTDPNNCGVCGTPCHQSQICKSGHCQCPNGTDSEFCSCDDPDLDCGEFGKCCQKLDGGAVCQATCAICIPPTTQCCPNGCPHPPFCVLPGDTCPPPLPPQ